MKKLVTIIPIHKFDDKIDKMLGTVLNSINNQKTANDYNEDVCLVIAKPIKKEIDTFIEKAEFNNINLLVLINDGETDFQSQVNYAFGKLEYEYITLVEYDDEVNHTYYKNIYKYIETMPEVDIFLSMIIETNTNNEGYELRNNHVWSKQFVGDNNDMGYLNVDLLNEYSDFKICGSIMKRSKFISAGMLKKNITLSFQYEFLLRMLNNNAKIFTIPKLMYKHVLLREGSLFDGYMKSLSLKERKFWFDVAKKESFFNKEREIDLSSLTK